jgi:hypothetical protein
MKEPPVNEVFAKFDHEWFWFAGHVSGHGCILQEKWRMEINALGEPTKDKKTRTNSTVTNQYL